MAEQMAAREAEMLDTTPVRKTIRVRAGVERAFRVFAQQMDSWWPRTHHIGNSPMKRIVVEEHPGGSIYTEQEDGTKCPWGTVLAWEPPERFVMAWQVSPKWQFEPELTKCSEVEVRFTPERDGGTLVELEHREIHKHGGEWQAMRQAVGSDRGWGSLLAAFGQRVEEGADV